MKLRPLGLFVLAEDLVEDIPDLAKGCPVPVLRRDIAERALGTRLKMALAHLIYPGEARRERVGCDKHIQVPDMFPDGIAKGMGVQRNLVEDRQRSGQVRRSFFAKDEGIEIGDRRPLKLFQRGQHCPQSFIGHARAMKYVDLKVGIGGSQECAEWGHRHDVAGGLERLGPMEATVPAGPVVERIPGSFRTQNEADRSARLPLCSALGRHGRIRGFRCLLLAAQRK